MSHGVIKKSPQPPSNTSPSLFCKVPNTLVFHAPPPPKNKNKKTSLPVNLSIYLPLPLINPDNHGTALKLPPSNVLVFEYRFRPI